MVDVSSNHNVGLDDSMKSFVGSGSSSPLPGIGNRFNLGTNSGSKKTSSEGMVNAY